MSKNIPLLSFGQQYFGSVENVLIKCRSGECSLFQCLMTLTQAWMATRPAYQLRGPLAAWSTFLAVFSMVAN